MVSQCCLSEDCFYQPRFIVYSLVVDTMNRTDKAKSQQTSSLLRESAQILAATEQERLALENKLKKTAKELYAIHDELYACNAQRGMLLCFCC